MDILKIPVWINSKQNPYITGIDINPESIQFHCDAGDEDRLFNSLPLLVSKYGKVVKGITEVYIILNIK